MATIVEEIQSPFGRAAAEGLLGKKSRGGVREGGHYPLGKPRVGREIMAARLHELSTALLDGAAVPGSDMVLFIRQLEADETSAFYIDGRCQPLSYGQARRMVRKAEKSIAGMVEKDKEKLLTEHIAKRRRLYYRAISRNDVRTALAVLDSEADLLGLFPERAALPGASGGVNLQVLVQAVIAAEAKTLEVKTLEMVPVEATATLIEGSNGEETERGGGCRDEAIAVGSETLP